MATSRRHFEGSGNDEGWNDTKRQRTFKDKHSLDSDEEDAPDESGQLSDEDIEGQEVDTVEFDDEIKITPFNLKEEYEEGHFDKNGMYILHKDKEIHDNWMDEIDSVEVKRGSGATKVLRNEGKYGQRSSPEDYRQWKKAPGDVEAAVDDDDEEEVSADSAKFIDKVLDILKPGESVTKALRRLGGGKPLSTAERLKLKKKQRLAAAAAAAASTSGDTQAHVTESKQEPIEETETDKEKLLRLTGLADRLLAAGHMDIYQDTYEKLSFDRKKFDPPSSSSSTSGGPGPSAAAELDMFGETIDGADLTKKSEIKSTTAPSSDVKEENEVTWEYKSSTASSGDAGSGGGRVGEEKIVGPLTTKEMMELKESGKLGSDGVLCRRINTEMFYNSNRLDFDLF